MSTDERFDAALPDALALVGAVHDRLPDEAAHVLAGADLPALCVVLAALVPDDCSVSVLLAWTSRTNVLPIRPQSRPTRHTLDVPDDIRAAHTEYTRLLTAGLPVPDEVREGDRKYNAARKAAARARRAAA
jgi:hypothetical protein